MLIIYYIIYIYYMYILQSLQKRKVPWLCPYRDRVFLNFELRVFLYFAFMFWAASSSAGSLKRIVAWQFGLPMRNKKSGPSQFVAERLRVCLFFDVFRCSFVSHYMFKHLEKAAVGFMTISCIFWLATWFCVLAFGQLPFRLRSILNNAS